MFWYLLNIFLILSVALWPMDRNTVSRVSTNHITYARNNMTAKRICIVGTLNWIVLSGFRHYSVGNDTYAYRDYHFMKTMGTDWSVILRNFYLKYAEGLEVKDPGYTILEKTFQIFTDNYTMWLIAIASFFFILMGRKIYKYSASPTLSYVLFSTLFYSFFAITGHRQTIATGIAVFIGSEMILRRKLLPFLLIVAIASTIHASAICFLPFYWLSQLKINKITLCIYWCGIILSFTFRNQFMVLLQRMVGYESYGFSDTAAAGNFMFLMFAIAVFFTVFYQSIMQKVTKYFSTDVIKMIEMSCNAVFIACIFMSLLLINPAFMRVVQYYSIFLLILLPVFQFLFTPASRKIFNGVCIAVMIILLIRTHPFYYFVWQKL